MNIIWLLCALFPIQSISQDVAAKYVLTPGAKCKSPYQPLTSGWKDCKAAAVSLGFKGDSVAHVVWNSNNTRIWGSNRPQGCFRSTGNGRFHYNSGAGGKFSGDDKILCHLKGEVAYSHNCNCGTRLANYQSGKATAQLCRNACEANSKCKSFGLWTKQSRDAGHCALFDKSCVPTCPAPTNVAGGWLNDVFNRDADEVSENNVITWLRKLIAEGLNEIDDINDKVNISAKVLEGAQSRFRDAGAKEEEARVNKDNAAKELNIIKGECTAKQNTYDRTAPDIKKEIAVFIKVISTLKSLLSGDKGLLEEDKVEVTSFISLADQADPTKVEKVINLVDGLLTASQKQLNDLANEVKSCKIVLANKATEFGKLLGIWKVAFGHMETRKKELDVSQGKHDAIVKHANRRIPIVSREVDDLRKVIDLISTLL